MSMAWTCNNNSQNKMWFSLLTHATNSCYFGFAIYRGYPAKRTLSAIRKHGGYGPFGRIPSICSCMMVWRGMLLQNDNVISVMHVYDKLYQVQISMSKFNNPSSEYVCMSDVWFSQCHSRDLAWELINCPATNFGKTQQRKICAYGRVCRPVHIAGATIIMTIIMTCVNLLHIFRKTSPSNALKLLLFQHE